MVVSTNDEEGSCKNAVCEILAKSHAETFLSRESLGLARIPF